MLRCNASTTALLLTLPWRVALFLWAVLLGVCPAAVAQSAAAPGAGQTQPEVTLRDQPPTIRATVNLVLVPVIVRDREGHAVGNLRKEDFELFDAGKRQTITQFSAEAGGGRVSAPSPAPAPAAPGEKVRPAPARPRQFVAYLFDDVHLTLGDLAFVRDGADRHMATLDPSARAAIFTTSGRTHLEFTDDRSKLHETLLKLHPNPISRPTIAQCPDVSHYIGYVVFGKEESTGAPILEALTTETMDCLHLDPQMIEMARRHAQAAVRQAVVAGEFEAKVAGMAVKQVVRRMGTMPGLRTVIVLSPGYLTPEGAQEPTLDAADLAARLNVVISALDARGLYSGIRDAAQRGVGSASVTQIKQDLNRQGAVAESTPLAQLADGTGGNFVHDTNDIDRALNQIATPPEYLYILGFSPQDLKPDGSFHNLKVRLNRKGNLGVQARRGYYATKQLTDPAEAARRELEEAVFAPEDLHDPAVEVHTEFFKSSAATAHLVVLTRLDFERLSLEKTGGRNANDLTVVSCLFDHNGNFVTGKQQLVKLRLSDETVAERASAGYTVKTTFDTQPGTYAVRVAVRDAQGQLLSAESAVMEIP